MEMLRSFIAVEIPENVKSRMAEARNAFRPLDPYIRWVRAEGVHLTLKFLGDIDPAQVAPVSASIEQAVKDMRHFTVKISGAGVFPNLKYPRVLWVGIVQGGSELSAIYQNLEGLLKELGFEPESRPFQPHLTLGRFRDGRQAGRLLTQEMLQKGGAWEESFTVSQVRLMRSQLHPSGAIYTVLKECTLSG